MLGNVNCGTIQINLSFCLLFKNFEIYEVTVLSLISYHCGSLSLGLRRDRIDCVGKQIAEGNVWTWGR
jgi:hypothetical protein